MVANGLATTQSLNKITRIYEEMSSKNCEYDTDLRNIIQVWE